MGEKDRLYEDMPTNAGDFVFDQRVVQVFPDMIRRSVPGYGTVVPMIGMLARRYAQPGTRIYDLGCSLGAATLAMRAAVRAPGLRIVAVDNSPEMIASLERELSALEDDGRPPIEVRLADLMDTPIDQASVVVLNFTLQFVEPNRRDGLLARIADGLLEGGVLLLSEKICFDDPAVQALQTEWHHDFKRSQGYSDLEIARKRDALENVLVPESMQRHRERLLGAGFQRVVPWFQGFNFVSMVVFR
jgi:tRNA (cmo5U34)-methyltransferase